MGNRITQFQCPARPQDYCFGELPVQLSPEQQQKLWQKENEQRQRALHPAINPLQARQFVDPTCDHFHSFEINGYKITSKEPKSYIFGKKKLKGVCYFTATFTNLSEGVALAVSDIKNKSQDLKDWNNNYIAYWDKKVSIVGNPDKYQKRIQKYLRGNGFRQWQPITMWIDLIRGQIQWRTQRYTQGNQKQVLHRTVDKRLKDKKITWVPYILMVEKDCTVEISNFVYQDQ